MQKKETKTEFHDKVDRSSAKLKINGLVDNSKKFIEIMKHELM